MSTDPETAAASVLLEDQVEVDAGLLAAFDQTPIDEELYNSSIPGHLLALTLHSTQALVSRVFSLPITKSSGEPFATLPPPTTILPREKPLPKPKPPTKWERFAKEKGISHRNKDKMEFDETKQEWVPRWGRNGKNRGVEDDWAVEVKASADADLDPAMTARRERKARIAKNNRQHASNISAAASQASSSISTAAAVPSASGKAAAQASRKSELDRSMLISKTSTASLGRFDKKIEGEPKAKGIKRKFEDNLPVQGWKGEKEAALNVLRRVESSAGKKAKSKGGDEVNVRKAVRYHEREERNKRRARD